MLTDGVLVLVLHVLLVIKKISCEVAWLPKEVA
jgi:hypothetical protein